MKKLFGLNDERGFVLLEVLIGLPLIIMMIWSMSNLFIGTWQHYRDEVADMILQQEMNSAMQRIVDDVKIASKVTVDKNFNSPHRDRLRVDFFEVTTKGIRPITTESTENKNINGPIFYFASMPNDATTNRIYRQRTINYNNQSITGDNAFSQTHVIVLKFDKKSESLLHIRLEAVSNISNHKLTLNTAVYILNATDRVSNK